MKTITLYTSLIIIGIGVFLKLHAQDTSTRVTERMYRNERLIFYGKITNAQTGEPLASASIYFLHSRIGGTSNTLGLYK